MRLMTTLVSTSLTKSVGTAASRAGWSLSFGGGDWFSFHRWQRSHIGVSVAKRRQPQSQQVSCHLTLIFPGGYYSWKGCLGAGRPPKSPSSGSRSTDEESLLGKVIEALSQKVSFEILEV